MKILLVVDMQNDFINGSLGTKEAEAIVDKVKAKVDAYKENGDLVIYTADTHQDDYMDTLEGKYLPVVHCIKETDGWRISDALNVDYENDYIIEKYTFGAVTLGELIGGAYTSYCEKNNLEGDDVVVESLELVGLCTDICVVSNALIAKSTFNFDVIVDASCCAGVTPEKHKAALEVMKSCQVNVIND